MKFFTRRLFALNTLVLIGIGHAANADYFPKDTIINYTVPNDAYIGYANYYDKYDGKNGTSPTVNLVSGGTVRNGLNAYNNSTVNLKGGGIGFSVNAFDHSTINFTGGFTDIDLDAHNSSIVNIGGGVVGKYLYAEDNSTINVTSGTIRGELYITDDSSVNLSGGSVHLALNISGNSTLNIFGTELSDTIINPDFSGWSQYLLSGNLADGTSITGKQLYVQNGVGAKFTLNAVPEPGSVALLIGMAAVGFGILRKHRQ